MSRKKNDTSDKALEKQALENFEKGQRLKRAVENVSMPGKTVEDRTVAARKREEDALRRAEEMARLRAKKNSASPEPPLLLPNRTNNVSPTSLEEEMGRAEVLYGQAIHYAHDFLEDIRAGRSFDYQAATPMVDGFINSIFRNESAAAALCKLRSCDEYTYTHSINVAVLSILLGKQIGLSRDMLRILGMAGMFHDVGKAIIPEAILNKPGGLTPAEMDIMRTHAQEGYEILRSQPSMPFLVARAALEHHERHDGSGYPQGLVGDQIALVSRVVGVVDVYDALTSKRVYKDPLPPGKVLGMMYKWRLSGFQPDIVEHFIKSLGIYPVGSMVRLSSGEYAIVMEHNLAAPLRPLVKIVFDCQMNSQPSLLVDLAQPSRHSRPLLIADIVNPQEYGVDVAKLMR